MNLKRTHNCGQLRSADVEKEVVLSGWVENRRDHGGMLFIDLKDRYGITQIFFSPEEDRALSDEARELKPQSVVSVRGVVRPRPAENVNPERVTGDIEVLAREVELLNRSETPPFEIIDDLDASEDLRMKYRYLDLRRDVMRKNIMFRHRVYQEIRNYLGARDFVEVETPFLIKSTPEGARDYLVPSRNFPGRFFALPQSPQILKQLLMIAGFDRYFQIVRCFRDEDIRADRQPEFTQLDIEMAFVDVDDVIAANEGLVCHLFKTLLGVEVKAPFRRIPYDEALDNCGLDAPDIRFGMTLFDLTDICAKSEFKVFKNVVGSGGVVKAICAPNAGGFSRKQIDEVTKVAVDYGAKGLVWFKVESDAGKAILKSPTAKFFDSSLQDEIIGRSSAKEGDLLLLVADEHEAACTATGRVRLHVARVLDIIPRDAFVPCWVTEFPMFETLEDERLGARHHPFTSPTPETVQFLESDPSKVRARAYDLVINGVEVAGGSIRNHRPEFQERVFKALGIGEEEAREKFGFLVDALKYGAPPHGGIAYGFDRFVALLLGLDRIRDVIAFPKTTTAQDLMTGAPSPVSADQLDELKLKLAKDKGGK